MKDTWSIFKNCIIIILYITYIAMQLYIIYKLYICWELINTKYNTICDLYESNLLVKNSTIPIETIQNINDQNAEHVTTSPTPKSITKITYTACKSEY